MKLPRLDNWVIEIRGEYSVAHGVVYDSDKFQDGDVITTSYLRRYSLVEKKVTTKNTTYLLGWPHSFIVPPEEEDVPCVTQPIDQLLS